MTLLLPLERLRRLDLQQPHERRLVILVEPHDV